MIILKLGYKRGAGHPCKGRGRKEVAGNMNSYIVMIYKYI